MSGAMAAVRWIAAAHDMTTQPMTTMGGGMGSMTSMRLLPDWLRAAWAAGMCVVMALHLWHAARIRGQSRWWHAGHVLMAVGMALMYALPQMSHPRLYHAGIAVYSVAAAAALAAALASSWRTGAIDPLWAFAALDMGVMIYMCVTDRVVALNWMLVAYLGGQFIMWTLNLWCRWTEFPTTTPPVPPGDSAVGAGWRADVGRSPGGQAVLAPARPIAVRTPEGAPGLLAHCSPSVRMTLALMAAAMAYMLALM